MFENNLLKWAYPRAHRGQFFKNHLKTKMYFSTFNNFHENIVEPIDKVNLRMIKANFNFESRVNITNLLDISQSSIFDFFISLAILKTKKQPDQNLHHLDMHLNSNIRTYFNFDFSKRITSLSDSYIANDTFLRF